MVAKNEINSLWGKSVERKIKQIIEILDSLKSPEKIQTVFANVAKGKMILDGVIPLTDSSYLYKTRNVIDEISPNLHRGYSPASVMVVAYGRIALYERILKPYGKNVLYHDTDSGIFLWDPLIHPPVITGEVLGDWSEEKISKKGIHKFVSLGPKTYAIKTFDGETIVKTKGISLNHSNSKLVNFESMEKLAKEFIANPIARNVIKVPQTIFSNSLEKGMSTWNMLKELRINPDDLKGVFDKETGYIWPFGSNKV